MKHIVWAFIAVLAIAGGTGCNKLHNYFVHKNKACSQCGGQGCPACGKGAYAGHGGHHDMNASYNQNGDPHYYGGQGGGACPNCGPGGAGGGAGFGQGPGQVVYPYYTTRGPRDFLQNNPPELGP